MSSREIHHKEERPYFVFGVPKSEPIRRSEKEEDKSKRAARPQGSFSFGRNQRTVSSETNEQKESMLSDRIEHKEDGKVSAVASSTESFHPGSKKRKEDKVSEPVRSPEFMYTLGNKKRKEDTAMLPDCFGSQVPLNNETTEYDDVIVMGSVSSQKSLLLRSKEQNENKNRSFARFRKFPILKAEDTATPLLERVRQLEEWKAGAMIRLERYESLLEKNKRLESRLNELQYLILGEQQE